MRTILATVMAVSVVGCMTGEHARAMIESFKDWKCQRDVTVRGTPAYVQCRAQLDEKERKWMEERRRAPH
jgi:hypothetical protein